MCQKLILLFSIIFILKLCNINGEETNINDELTRTLLNSLQLGDTPNSLDLVTKLAEYIESQNQRIQVLESAVNKVNGIVDALQQQMNFQVRENKKLKSQIGRIVSMQRENVQANDHPILLAVQEKYNKKLLGDDHGNQTDTSSDVNSQDTNIKETQTEMSEKIGQVENKDEQLNDLMTQSSEFKSDEYVGLAIRQRQLNYQHIAFSAYLDHELSYIGVGTTIKCNQILHNEGNGYNAFTGVFTAPISGVYFFTFTIHNHHRETNVRLVVDGQNIVGAVIDSRPPLDGLNQMGSNSAIIPVNSGQAVWLEEIADVDGELYSSPDYRQVTFTGFLLA